MPISKGYIYKNYNVRKDRITDPCCPDRLPIWGRDRKDAMGTEARHSGSSAAGNICYTVNMVSQLD